jgi:uncharacterized protein (TIGR02996 family)
MTHEEAFLAAILEAPDDDTPRLIYADWLLDQAAVGAPTLAARGELIHVQCALAKLAPCSRPPELQARERELLGAHHREWGSFFQRIGCHCWEYRRGFVEGVGLPTSDFLAHAPALCRATPLRHLKLYDAASAIVALAASPHLARLRELDLEHNDLGDEEALLLASSPHLGAVESLLLWSNRIGDAGARALASSPKLPALTRLDLSANAIGDAGALALASSPLLARLALLDLQRNRIGDEGARALVASPHAGARTWFELGKNPISLAVKDALRTRFAGRIHVC